MNSIQPKKLIQWILFGSLFGSTFLYVGVLFLIKKDSPDSGQMWPIWEDSFQLGLTLSAFVCFVLAFVIPRVLKRAPDQVQMLARWGMLEASLLHGFIMGFLGSSPRLVLPFFVVSTMGFLLSMPSRWNQEP